MTIEINELIIEVQVADASPPTAQGPTQAARLLDEEYLIEKLKQEIIAYLIERELL